MNLRTHRRRVAEKIGGTVRMQLRLPACLLGFVKAQPDPDAFVKRAVTAFLQRAAA
jgi:hypothetical protein